MKKMVCMKTGEIKPAKRDDEETIRRAK